MNRFPVLTDSTTGAVSATFTIDDTTASVKDDLATVAAIIKRYADIIRGLDKRIADLESRLG